MPVTARASPSYYRHTFIIYWRGRHWRRGALLPPATGAGGSCAPRSRAELGASSLMRVLRGVFFPARSGAEIARRSRGDIVELTRRSTSSTTSSSSDRTRSRGDRDEIWSRSLVGVLLRRLPLLPIVRDRAEIAMRYGRDHSSEYFFDDFFFFRSYESDSSEYFDFLED